MSNINLLAESKPKASGDKREVGMIHEAEDDTTIRPGDYRVQVQLLEAKDIIPAKGVGVAMFSNNQGSWDPMVEVKVGDQKKNSNYASDTLSPIFNETLFFDLKNVSTTDLEDTVINLSLYDHNSVAFNAFLGAFSVDAAYIYQMNGDHELYRSWVWLTDTTDATEGVKGYLRVTINVLGPGDRPPVHDEKRDLKDKKNNGVSNLFSPGLVDRTEMVVKINIYRAEHLPAMDWYSGKLDPYVKASFAGSGWETKVIYSDQNPEFDTQLQLAITLPCLNRTIKWEVWDSDLPFDERVGTFVMKFPPAEERKKTKPRWVNLYGPLPGVTGEKADYMTKFSDSGTYYRGRVWYSLDFEEKKEAKTRAVKLKYKLPHHPRPNPPVRIYILRVDLFDGFELPNTSTLTSAHVFVTCGPYQMMSEKGKIVNNTWVWNYAFPDLKIKGPAAFDQIYDVIIYLSSDDKIQNSVSYIRIPVFKILYSHERDLEIKKWTLVEDISRDKLHDEEFPGVLNMRITFFDENPPPRSEKHMPTPEEYAEIWRDYVLRMYLYMGRDLPSADDTGLSDPFIVFKCAGAEAESHHKAETLNPGWFQTLEMDIKIPEIGNDLVPTPWISMICYDRDMFGYSKDLLGRAIINIDGPAKVQIEKGRQVAYVSYRDPEWHDLYFDALDEQKGFVLVGYGLISTEVAENCPPVSIVPPTVSCNLNIVCIGLRDLVDSISFIPLKRVTCKFDVSGDTKDAMETNKHSVRYNSCNIGEIVRYFSYLILYHIVYH